ncbi:MAG: nuclear transport factor 2 family protein [Cytophagales bacterium]|nr:nuclear transport factor 2 family protein [Cytophagales bacterium]
MKKILILLFALAPFFGFAQNEESLKEAELNRFKVMVAKDTPGLQAVLHKDLVYFHSSGVQDSKETYIASIASGKSNYMTITPEEMQQRVYGKTGINTGIVNILQQAADGTQTTVRLRFTDVFVYADKRWQMVSWQSTKLVPAQKP